MTPSTRRVPVSMGSPRFRTAETSTVLVTEATFPPHAVLPRHAHERAIFAIMCGGAFETTIAGRRLECVPGTVWSEPISEPHANYVSPRGARVVVFQPALGLPEMFRPVDRLLSDVIRQQSGEFTLDARRVAREIADPDAISPLAIDSLFMGLIVKVGRLDRASRRPSRPPLWLLRIREALNDQFRQSFSLSGLSDIAGVSPSRLAREFRAHFGLTPGDYVRKLRCDWAAERLARSDDSLSTIAAEAGYHDQSHFTRQCKRLLGANPGEYRRAHRA